MPLEGLQLGRYHLLNVLGSGGMGEVYLGEDEHINRQVAIKVIRTEPLSYPDKEATRDSERLFRREIRAIAALDHPHILPLFDYGEETVHNIAYTYIVMPLRQEGSLAQWLRQHNTSQLLSSQQVAYIISQAASALNHAHKHQIIHQDVKPSNFLIRSNEEQPDLPDLMLADFGIAKFYTSTASLSQIVRGTPAYMAPEQWSGQPVAATDQYALAIMAYLFLVGSLPFQGRQEQVMYQHLEVQPPLPSKLNATLPKDVDTVLLHALAKKPEERFATVAAFARALGQALQNTATVQLRRPVKGTLASQSSSGAPGKPAEKAKSPANNLRATLTISETDAANGTRRILMLPEGRKIAITIPANVSDGHVISLKDQDKGKERIITVTLAIKPSEEEHPAPPDTDEDYIHLSDHAQTASAPLLQHSDLIDRIRGIPISRTALIVGLVLLLVLGSAGTFYFRNFNYIHRAILLNETVKNPYAPPAGSLALNDPLTDNSNGYFWGEGSDAGGNCNFLDGSYHASTSMQNHARLCYPENTSFSNFAYQVQLTIIKGNCGGIIFRADNLKFYYFFICQDGSFGLRKYIDGDTFILLRPGNQVSNSASSSPIHQDLNTSNTIGVNAFSNSITLYINQQQITQINDSSYSHGKIGVAAESITTPTEVKFSNAQVWTF